LKKAPVLITAAIVLLVVGGFFIYEKFLVTKPLNAWDIVPADAVLVYEKDNCETCVEALTKSQVFRIVEQALFYHESIPDTLEARLRDAFLNNTALLVSLHPIKKDDFDFVAYFPLAVSDLFGSMGFTKRSREFSSIMIDEYKNGNIAMSVATIENVQVISLTPFLIEDVIRTYKEKSRSGFRSRITTLQSFSRIRDDGGNLYVNFKNFSELLSLFSQSSSTPNIVLGTAASLDIKTNENNIVLNGFSVDSADARKNLLSVFKYQSPVAFGLKHMVPTRVSSLTSYGVSDGSRFYSELSSFVRQRRPRMLDSLNQITAESRVDLRKLYSTLGDEFAVSVVESSSGFAKIALIETTDPQHWTASLGLLAKKYSMDTIFFERYSDFEIREVPVARFAEKLLWPFVQGFKNNFYVRHGNVILFGDNLEELKHYLDDIEDEDTWGKSVSQNQFLETTLLESNVSLYVNMDRIWNMLARKLNPRWQQFVRDNRSLLYALQMSSFQFSHLNNTYYTNIQFTYSDEKVVAGSRNRKDRIVTNFDRGIAKLYAVKSHVTRGDEVLLQDSVNDLSLVGSDGTVLWKLPIGDKIVSDVSQVDFFRNGKLQYFFATQDAIHVIDRLGNYVEPYPLFLPNVKIDYVSIIDYDNSRKYRFLVADVDGKLWMYDKDGANLDGWKPNALGGPLAMSSRHHRINGKDYIFAALKSGKVFLMNRRGEDLRKFPINSEAIPSGDFFVERGSTLADSYFVLVSSDGFRVRINPEGKIQSRETLPKNSIASTFSLVNEKSNKSYLILQQDGRLLTLTDPSGRKILSTSMGLVNPSDVKFYDFGAGNVFITITEKLQALSYVFDGQGNLLTTPPIQTSALEIRPVNSRGFNVFFISNKSLIIQPL
jgi:hypothetical protein